MRDLFRRQALDHRQAGWLGEIQLIRPVSGLALTALVVVGAVGVALLLGIGEYTRKARVTGYLIPDAGLLRIVAPQAGTVLERRAAEGDAVRRGDVLFVLGVDRATLEGNTEDSVRRSLAQRERSLADAARRQQELLAARRSSLDQRLVARRRELAQIDVESELQQRRLALAQAALERQQALQAQNFISEAQLQARSEEVFAVQAELQALERQRAGQRREIAALEAERLELPLQVQSQLGEIDRDRSALAQEAAQSDARRTVVVRAPEDGTLGVVTADPGQAVAPAVALASLVPAGARLQAQLFAPSTAVGFVRPDQAVQLRYQAFPYQKFGHQPGRIVQVSRIPLQASELAALPLAGAAARASSEPLYRITVSIDAQAVQAYGQAQPLSAGMQLDADVLLERRRLIEWIFEPLFSITGRV